VETGVLTFPGLIRGFLERVMEEMILTINRHDCCKRETCWRVVVSASKREAWSRERLSARV
jgi:hypothetical protein